MSNLKQATEGTPDVAAHYKNGLQALKSEHTGKIKVSDTKKLTGSLDIDNATKALYPKSNRWDYVIEYNEEVFFIEIHPASTKNVLEVLLKLSWLKTWLIEKAPLIDKLKSRKASPYYWIATGGIKILQGSKQAKQLAQSGLKPIKYLELR